MKIGVLALQGAFREHVTMLRGMGVDAVEVRLPEQLQVLDGLIIPGGESTTIGKLATRYGLIEPIRAMVAQGKPVWGTCAGMIVLAKQVEVANPRQRPALVSVMDVTVERNALGGSDSFETGVDVSALHGQDEHPFHAIFIRAPLIETVGPGVEVLARLDNVPLSRRAQKNLLATSFHPELTHDPRFTSTFVHDWQTDRRRRTEDGCSPSVVLRPPSL